MPKVKSHRGTAKRVKQTGTGLFKVKRTGMRHLLRKKTTKQKRGLGNDLILTGGNDRAARTALNKRLPKRKVIVYVLDANDIEVVPTANA
jgi:large subunit ribosomal protein L35